MTEPSLSSLAQLGAVGVILAVVLGIVLRLFQRLIERLMAHLDLMVIAVREVRDEVRGARAAMAEEREEATSKIIDEIRNERRARL